MQRTRVRGVITNGSGNYTSYDRIKDPRTGEWRPEYLSGGPVNHSTINGDRHVIIDVYRSAPRSRRDFSDVLPVTHTVLTYKPINTGDGKFFYVDQAKTHQRRHVCLGYKGSIVGFQPSDLRPHPLKTLPHKEAIDQFNAGGVAQEVSLLNFIAELGEIRQLLSLVSPNRLKRVWESGRFDKEVSGGFLAYSFGIRPLISDVVAIASYSQNLQKRLAWLCENKGKTVSLDFRTTLESQATPRAAWTPDYTGVAYQWVTYHATYHAFCRWKVQYGPAQQALEKLKYFNRYFGTSKLLSAAWEAIPYSFIVDWVSNLGSLVSALELPSALKSGITAIGYSTKEVGEHKAHSVYLGKSTWELSHVLFKNYTRYPGIPTTIQNSVDLSTVSGRQLALAFALTHQKLM